MSGDNYEPWPELPFPAFAGTLRLLHAACQMLGKLKSAAPPEPYGAHLPLWLTSRGLTTGPVPTGPATLTAELDLIDHRCRVGTAWGAGATFPLGAGSVRDLYRRTLDAVAAVGAWPGIDPLPVGITDPVPFDEDGEPAPYDAYLASAWWRVMVSTGRVLARHHAAYRGLTPPVGLSWDTLDLRDVRLLGATATAPPPALGAGAQRGCGDRDGGRGAGQCRDGDAGDEGRAAGDADGVTAIECGFWPGSPHHPRPLFYSCAQPESDGVATAPVEIGAWDGVLHEFVLDYDDLRAAADPDATLLRFLDIAYRAQAALAARPDGLGDGALPAPATSLAGGPDRGTGEPGRGTVSLITG